MCRAMRLPLLLATAAPMLLANTDPGSIPPQIKQFLDLNSGNDRGRIWRIAPDGFKPRKPPTLSKATTAELVALLPTILPGTTVTELDADAVTTALDLVDPAEELLLAPVLAAARRASPSTSSSRSRRAARPTSSRG